MGDGRLERAVSEYLSAYDDFKSGVTDDRTPMRQKRMQMRAVLKSAMDSGLQDSSAATYAVLLAERDVLAAAKEQRLLAVESFHNRHDIALCIAHAEACETTQNAVATLLAAERVANGGD